MTDAPYSIKLIPFHSDTILAAEMPEGIFVAVKPMSDALGLVWRAQWKRLQSDPILREGITMRVMPGIGNGQEVTLLRLDLVNGWLFTIDSARVKAPETREKVISYQRECYSVLFEHFYGKAKTAAALNADIPADAKIAMVRECRLTFGHQQAQQLWSDIGLPAIVNILKRDPEFWKQ